MAPSLLVDGSQHPAEAMKSSAVRMHKETEKQAHHGLEHKLHFRQNDAVLDRLTLVFAEEAFHIVLEDPHQLQ